MVDSAGSFLVEGEARQLADGRARLVAGLVAAGCFALLYIAASLEAMPRGVGTHTQLGFSPCLWITHLDMPCPTCGMTTAFTNAVHGDLGEGFKAQPFGFLLAILSGVGFWLGLFVLVTGSQVYRCATALWKPGFVWTMAALAVFSWLYKIWDMTYSGEFG